MEEQKEESSHLIQWHSAFVAGVQIELSKEAEYLEFESEHLLSTKPMQMDLLIIKKDKGYQLLKNIGKIFRTYNIVEYKSPDDYLSVDDFYKVYGYACFYKADTGKVDQIKVEEMTITFVCQHYPRKLIKYWEKQGREVARVESGIYYVFDPYIAMQLIVQKELDFKENLWLRSLTNDMMKKEETDILLEGYNGHEKENLYQSVMKVVVEANKKVFGGDIMSRAIWEILEPYAQDRIEQEVEARVKVKVEEQVKAKVEEQVKVKVEEQVKAKVEEQVKAKVEEQVKEKVEASKSEARLEERVEMIEKLVDSKYLDLEKICKAIGITVEEYEAGRKRLAMT